MLTLRDESKRYSENKHINLPSAKPFKINPWCDWFQTVSREQMQKRPKCYQTKKQIEPFCLHPFDRWICFISNCFFFQRMFPFLMTR